MIGTLIALRTARRQFAARARGDIDELMRGWDEDAVFEFPGPPPWGGRVVGKAAIRDWFERFHRQFGQARFELVRVHVARPFALTGNNELAVEWSATLEDRNGKARTGRGTICLVVRSGRVAHAREYFFEPPAGTASAEADGPGR